MTSIKKNHQYGTKIPRVFSQFPTMVSKRKNDFLERRRKGEGEMKVSPEVLSLWPSPSLGAHHPWERTPSRRRRHPCGPCDPCYPTAHGRARPAATCSNPLLIFVLPARANSWWYVRIQGLQYSPVFLLSEIAIGSHLYSIILCSGVE